MMLVDARTGSKELLRGLVMQGVKAELATLPFGDFAFEGRGEGGTPLQIGIERKTTKDFLGSVRSGRLQGHQLGGLLQSYDRIWLLVEGIWRTDESGRLCRPIGGGRLMPISTGFRPTKTVDLSKQILTLCLRGGMHLWQTGTEWESVIFLAALYHFWTSKDLDEHKSHLAFHQTDIDKSMLAMMTGGKGHSMCRLIAKELPGIGWQSSAQVARHFKDSVQRMMAATIDEWAGIDVAAYEKGKPHKPRRLGLKRAMEIAAKLK